MNMKNEEIIAKINEFLVEEFEVEADTITPDAILKDTLGLDSLDYIDLVVVIESNFSFKVKPEDFVGRIILLAVLRQERDLHSIPWWRHTFKTT